MEEMDCASDPRFSNRFDLAAQHCIAKAVHCHLAYDDSLRCPRSPWCHAGVSASCPARSLHLARSSHAEQSATARHGGCNSPLSPQGFLRMAWDVLSAGGRKRPGIVSPCKARVEHSTDHPVCLVGSAASKSAFSLAAGHGGVFSSHAARPLHLEPLAGEDDEASAGCRMRLPACGQMCRGSASAEVPGLEAGGLGFANWCSRACAAGHPRAGSPISSLASSDCGIAYVCHAGNF
mmetsp:Transcript_16364/g.30594  ORF Transcript_16364/g.30594 Transcript_16364/m.30594 type:complete len:235 (+) Transcript_16364:586-1290(+)